MNEKTLKFNLAKEKNSIDDLDISVRCYQFLKNQVGIKTIDELTSKTSAEIKKAPGFNPKIMEEIENILANKDLSFKEEVNLEKEKNGWIDETEKYGREMKYFILLAKERHYNHLSEFHISGMNTNVLKKILSGQIFPKEIRIFYNKNKPEQIAVSYDNEGSGQIIDLYISGKALEDFFSNDLVIND